MSWMNVRFIIDAYKVEGRKKVRTKGDCNVFTSIPKMNNDDALIYLNNMNQYSGGNIRSLQIVER